ncbi:hypothetical protein CRD_00662 [Raphidiopsis brookii D9]|nr:hypothetical protein CRD_00662 [Raphidiopsis brookii D9]
MNNLLSKLPELSGLIVSCQAPVTSPLHNPTIIAAMAQASANNGAKAVRIDSPNHIKAVKQKVSVPIIGLWKQIIAESDVYITPQFHHALAVAEAGADIIAMDATPRKRAGGEKLVDIIRGIHQQIGKPVMADVDTFASAKLAIDSGADIVGTTLFGYTEETKNLIPPGWELLKQIVENLKVEHPEILVICEGGFPPRKKQKKH